MPDLVGPIQSLELASWLWLVLLFPLVGALGNALYSSGLAGELIRALRLGFSDDDPQKAKPAPRVVAPVQTSARIAIGSLALSLLAAVVYSLALFQLPSEKRFLAQPLWQLVRVGQLDVGFDLALDPFAALLVLLVTGLGTWVSISFARSATDSAAAWRFFAWFGFFVFSLLGVVLADNFLLVMIAWEGVGLSGLGLVGPRATDPRSTGGRVFLAQRAGDAALLVGVALLFWGLAGSWPSGGAFQSDLDPRVSAVQVVAADAALSAGDPALRGGAATKGKGFLTVTGLPGALVYLDESRTPILDGTGVPLMTPFSRHELDGGAHAFRVAPDDRSHGAGHDAKLAYALEGGILANYTIPRIAFGGDREVALTLLGPTLKFRELEDELALSSATAPREKAGHPIRDRLATRMVWGAFRVVTIACFLLLLGASAKSSDLFLHRWLASGSGAPSAITLIHGGGMLLAGAYLMGRFLFLFSLSSVALVALELALACAAALSAGLLVRKWRARAQ